MKLEGVVGVAVAASSSDPKQRCIVVYTMTNDRPPDLPRELDGYPVENQKTSPFRAL